MTTKTAFPAIVLLLLGWLVAEPALAAEISGRVRVMGRSAGILVTTVIYAEPLVPGPTPAPKRFKLIQRHKAFVPRVLAIPAGSTVDFTNEDLIFHNVFSLSAPRPFDLGLYRAGATRSRTFSEPAIYRVFCNIHPQMMAVLLVLATNFINEVDTSGNYRLELPSGRYRLTAWSERAQPASIEVTVAASPVAVPELTLDESKFVELPHKNKYGQDYPKSAYDPLKDK